MSTVQTRLTSCYDESQDDLIDGFFDGLVIRSTLADDHLLVLHSDRVDQHNVVPA